MSGDNILPFSLACLNKSSWACPLKTPGWMDSGRLGYDSNAHSSSQGMPSSFAVSFSDTEVRGLKVAGAKAAACEAKKREASEREILILKAYCVDRVLLKLYTNIGYYLLVNAYANPLSAALRSQGCSNTSSSGSSRSNKILDR